MLTSIKRLRKRRPRRFALFTALCSFQIYLSIELYSQPLKLQQQPDSQEANILDELHDLDFLQVLAGLRRGQAIDSNAEAASERRTLEPVLKKQKLKAVLLKDVRQHQVSEAIFIMLVFGDTYF